MPKKKQSPSFPTLDELRSFIADQPFPPTHNDIAHAFDIKGAERKALRMLLRQLKHEGTSLPEGILPPASHHLMMIEICDTDEQGRPIGIPVSWTQSSPAPRFPVLLPASIRNKRKSILMPGYRCFVRLSIKKNGQYIADWVRAAEEAKGEYILGRFNTSLDGGWITPTTKRTDNRIRVPTIGVSVAQEGDFVMAEVTKRSRTKAIEAHVLKVLVPKDDLTRLSLIAIHEQRLPHTFGDTAHSLAHSAKLPLLQGREDLRDVPLVTIDDEDARDFDDAVWAEADPDPENPGGWHAIVAIADVAYYVRAHTALDQEARERGNSVYFPDSVIPMLPEALSNEMCSLKPQEDRACLAVHLWFDSTGILKRYRFTRALMRSAARLTYSLVQKAYEGQKTDLDPTFIKTIIQPLYGVYYALAEARQQRGALEIDMAERRVYLDNDNKITHITTRPRYDSHRLIEELMIAANVAAATALEQADHPCVYRIHDRPDPAKVIMLRHFLKGAGLSLPKGYDLTPKDFNTLLHNAQPTNYADVIQELVLRTQSQAVYSTENHGHYGLGLQRYCHFTSPIRRYADLLVHRDLITALGLGEGGSAPEDTRDYQEIAAYISSTERRAATAERDTLDRYLAAYLKDKIGTTLKGRITGVTSFGLFVTLDEYAATGLLFLRALPSDSYRLDEKNHQLIGRFTRTCYRLGESIEVRLNNTEPFTGNIELSLAQLKKANKPKKHKKKKKKSSKKNSQSTAATEPPPALSE